MTIERLLQLRPHLAAVCDAHWWDPLQQSTREVLHNLRDFMTPLATATQVFGRETGEALSRVFEQVTGIEKHLLVFAENQPSTTEACDAMRQRLHEWFSKYSDTSNSNFDPIFLVGGYLDPVNTIMLSSDEAISAEKAILVDVRKFPNQYRRVG